MAEAAAAADPSLIYAPQIDLPRPAPILTIFPLKIILFFFFFSFFFFKFVELDLVSST